MEGGRRPKDEKRRLAFALVVLIPACRAQVEVAAEVATAVAFTEGPTVDAEGNVYFSEQRSQRIMVRTKVSGTRR